MTRAYRLLMRLYPRKHRAVFEKEMTTVFEEAAEEHRRRGWFHFLRFMAAEMAGAVVGSCGQWLSALRRAEQPQGAELAKAGDAVSPPEIAQAQRRLEANLRGMEYAIAHHQFTRARFFSEAERREREQLRQLLEKHGLAE